MTRLTPLACSLIFAAACGALFLAAKPAQQVSPAQPTQQTPPTQDDTATVHPGDALHAPFDTLLSNFVKDGWVDYAGLKEEGRDELRVYLGQLGQTDPASLDRPATLAFWLNAYNAFTLQLILEHHGKIESIKDISSSKRWDAERWTVHGENYSLDQIEHEILRPMGDARVHFGLVCASKSCPDLLSEAFLPSTLEAQLDAAARGFLADTFKGANVVTEDGWFGKDYNLYLSKIFSWFDDDFERGDTHVVDFVLPYLPDAAAKYVREHRDDIDVEYFDYDWSLNGV
ncbi:MAG: DUF547 domain-containing protein [Planctomycetota bacterium]|nr:MAG: DUF547 domain-containing protein [Planctomycetota bacterium]